MFTARQAFFGGDTLPDDLARLVLISAAAFLMLVTVRVIYIRLRSPKGSVERDRSIWGLISYAMFISMVVYDGLTRFGLPVDWVKVVLIIIAIGSGLIGVLTMVKFRWWQESGQVTQDESDRRVGERIRLRQEARDRGDAVGE